MKKKLIAEVWKILVKISMMEFVLVKFKVKRLKVKIKDCSLKNAALL